jgi:hypothetical protein
VTDVSCGEQECNVMDRRGFLAKSAVGGALVVGGGLY